MRVSFHPLFLLIIILAVWQGFVIYILASITAVLVHEFSHALVARHYGVKANKISLLPFGASLELDCVFLNKKSQVTILFAGAMGNMILGVICGAILWLVPEFFNTLSLFIMANTFVALLNLLPIYPLDGGKIVELYASNRVIKVMHWVSNTVFIALFILSCVWLNFALGFFSVVMFFTINTGGKNEYVATLGKVLDIVYNNASGDVKKEKGKGRTDF
ncbi:MAG: site-2 protease family protein [Firmicutes bacterium]|nr:site-2 protease family protein [Bacillota bacterium]